MRIMVGMVSFLLHVLVSIDCRLNMDWMETTTTMATYLYQILFDIPLALQINSSRRTDILNRITELQLCRPQEKKISIEMADISAGKADNRLRSSTGDDYYVLLSIQCKSTSVVSLQPAQKLHCRRKRIESILE
jgi:hypothetical protein